MHKVVALLLAAAMLTACSGSKPANETANTGAAEQKKEKEVEQKLARESIYMMYTASRGWAPDARPYKAESETITAANGQNGKAAVWRAYFASPSKRQIRTWVWSGTGDERGVSANVADDWNPSNADTQPFDINNLKVDSDKALETAKKRGGDELLKQNKDMPVKYLLNWNEREKTLSWHVLFGDNDELEVVVNATTGGYLRRLKEGKLVR